MIEDQALDLAIREAQLHQFASAALTGLIARANLDSKEVACKMAWNIAEMMMRTKPEHLK